MNPTRQPHPARAASRRIFGALLVGAALALHGCATTNQSAAIADNAQLQPGEGVVAVRVIVVGSYVVSGITVKSDNSEQTYNLMSVFYGQSDTVVFVGTLPAGRYQLLKMTSHAGTITRTTPLAGLTGKFDVEAGRATDLATMIHVPLPNADKANQIPTIAPNQHRWESRFALPLDPTPVPIEKILAARYPAIAATVTQRSLLGWVPGTVPKQPEQIVRAAAALADVVAPPAFLGGGRALTGGRLGLVVDHRAGAKPTARATGAVHEILAVMALKDGRWLAAGEEGYAAVSSDEGLRWQRLPGLQSDEIVIHMTQAPEGTVYLVAMSDHGTLVYSASPATLAWRLARALPTDRKLEHSFLNGPRQVDSAASTRDRLVVYTHPETLNTMDLRTGQWTTEKTPRDFHLGLVTSPDGLVMGITPSMWVTGTPDYGKTWKRQDAWMKSTFPVFTDRDHGLVISAGATEGQYQLRRTQDGGMTWTVEGPAAPLARTGQSLWLAPDGQTFYTIQYGQLRASSDRGRTWK